MRPCAKPCASLVSHRLLSEIDREDNWPQRLSGGEQQRLAIARVLLEKPDWLFLDEATSALDEELEAEIYRILIEALPKTTIVSIGHRSTLVGLHRHRFEMMPREGGGFEPLTTDRSRDLRHACSQGFQLILAVHRAAAAVASCASGKRGEG